MKQTRVGRWVLKVEGRGVYVSHDGTQDRHDTAERSLGAAVVNRNRIVRRFQEPKSAPRAG